MHSGRAEPTPPQSWFGASVLVVGDLMLDSYLRGAASRISPEAPVPILEVDEETNLPGGAANVAANIATLGGRPILCGVTGEDEAAAILTTAAAALGIDCSAILPISRRPTTRKTRLMGGRQQLLRMDREHTQALDEADAGELIRRVSALVGSVRAVVVSDYAKGVVSLPLMDALRAAARKTETPLLVDPKPANGAWFSEVTLLTPNAAEASQMCVHLGLGCTRVEEAGVALCRRLRSSVLITRGEHGMALFEDGKEMLTLPTRARAVYDVAGAGDTVMAALALGAASGLTLEASARIANAAAGLAVEKVGTATVTAKELFDDTAPH
ncbi:MAG: PfkB family carbohydrate kinase [Bryobacteraceae bacterium]